MASSYKKIHIIADANSTAQSAKRLIAKKYKNFPINDSDVLVVLGGDGFMLASLKKYQKYQLPFYGMNKGNRGFLLNKFDEKEYLERRSVWFDMVIVVRTVTSVVGSEGVSH